MNICPKVAVLLSTYNGEKYIYDQIRSILRQSGVDVHLFIRDDGSTDKTVEIISAFKDLGKISLMEECNIGPASSFLKLIFNLSFDFEFYAFSDQDDVWNENKLVNAIVKMSSYPTTEPVLYHSYAAIYDMHLNPLKRKKYIPINTFPASLVSSATGCTMVLNNSLFRMVRGYYPVYISMHDAWVYRICYAIGGNVIYDENSYIMFRQHGTNFSNSNASFLQKIKKLITENRRAKSRTAEELLKGYSDFMSAENRKVAFLLSAYRYSLINRLKLLFEFQIRTKKVATTFQNKILIIFGLL